MELKFNEKIFKEGSGVYLKSTLNVLQGTFFITSNRFVFCKRSGLLNALLGPIFMHMKKGNIVEFEVELKNITSINSEKHGFGNKFILKTKHNEDFAFQFNSNKSEWIETLIQAVKNSDSTINVNKIGDLLEFKN